MSFIETDSVCSGCGNIIRGRIDVHLNECQMWHMKKVLAKKNERRKKHARVV